MDDILKSTDYLFETSWEICNKPGALHTSISNKAANLSEKLDDRYILIGPDVWREETVHPEFEEDLSLFPKWREYAQNNGLRIRTGRWKIKGKPIVFLVDFTPFIIQKDKIFTELWELYKVDSLSGQWDYIEPALFGYSAGKIIENFLHYNLSFNDKIVAHFHDWYTGSGILYLKHYSPQVATVFTAHSTVAGRAAGNQNISLYKDIENLSGENLVKEDGLMAKHSLEKATAYHADIFTTTNDFTAKECEVFLKKEVNYIIPNGFGPLNDVPEEKDRLSASDSKKIMREVAQNMLGYNLPEDIYFIACSARYEFRNKGLDVIIDALESLQKEAGKCNKSIVSFLFVPTSHNGPDHELMNRIKGDGKSPERSIICSHSLTNEEYDPILSKLKHSGIDNKKEEGLKVFFVPAFLNGKDGVFNVSYYNLLKGIDLTLFPSYYEPWGYTVMESLAHGVPTTVSSISGVSKLIKESVNEYEPAVSILERADDNYEFFKDQLAERIKNYCGLSDKQKESAKKQSLKIINNLSWNKFLITYTEAYEKALDKVIEREDKFIDVGHASPVYHEIKKPIINEPIWNSINVHSHLPNELRYLEELVANYWWTWDAEALELIENIDPDLWQQVDYNPIIYFDKLSFEKLNALASDQSFIKKLDDIYSRFEAYMKEADNKKSPKVTYFSMEYGIHPSLKVYSGGLGVLAGDYLKEASDLNYDLVAMGLLYRYGYFKQLVSVYGEQLAEYEYQHFSKLPIKPVKDSEGNHLTVSIHLPGRTCYVRVWLVNVGRTPLYLLDTDIDANQEQDRFITHQLYGGDNENRLKQEMVLGIGGIRALQALGIDGDIYHSNEGHSAFIGLERLRHIIENDNVSFAVAKEIVRSTTLFTTHTPVPAGHDSFKEDLLRTYLSHYPERLRIQWEDFMNLGRSANRGGDEKFNMSFLAANMSQAVNGVSKLHGDVSKDILSPLWKGFVPSELHIGYVTNGVHLPTWTSKEWMDFYKNEFGEDFLSNQLDKDKWVKIYDVADEHIWHTKNILRKKLIDEIQKRLHNNWLTRNRNPREVVKIMDSFKPDKLTIGFARRFATYKRATLLFNNPERLAKILNNPERPVQFVFSGKAHPADKGGQALIKGIMEMSKKPEFQGKILFLQNYDMELAKKLVQGVDIWLNTPTRPLEASGTSGEKAVMNGTLHFSVLDGWWVEGYEKDAGWALPAERTFENQDFQNELDAEKIYSIIENEVVPAFYNRNMHGVPTDWISFIKNSIAHVAPKFTTTRMFTDYVDRFYNKLYERSSEIKEDEYHLAKLIASWKRKVFMSWDQIQVLSNKIIDGDLENVQVGGKVTAELVLNLADLHPDEIGAEFVISQGMDNVLSVSEYEFKKFENNNAYYRIEYSPKQSGTFSYGVRIFPKHKDLPHRQDFMLMRWI